MLAAVPNRSIFSQDSFAALYLQAGQEAAAFHSYAKPCWVISWELGEATGKAAHSQLPANAAGASLLSLPCVAASREVWPLLVPPGLQQHLSISPKVT